METEQTVATVATLCFQPRSFDDLQNVAHLLRDIANGDRTIAVHCRLIALTGEPDVVVNMETPNINFDFITLILFEALMYQFDVRITAVIGF